MTQPAQSQTVLAPPARAAIFLVVTVHSGAEGEVPELLADLAGLVRSVGFRVPEGGLNCVAGVGAELWERAYGAPRPAGLHPFREVAGAAHRAVATPGDLLFHIRAARQDLCFELAGKIADRLAGYAEIVDEVHGFRYFDERDLLGFVDGTENPAGADAIDAVTVGAEDSRFAGGSYVVVQKYLHDVDRWNALSVEEQQRVIGRTKLDDVELADDVKPANSHVALNTIVDADGTQRQIVRDNMVFGSVGAREFGTYFIGYTSSPDVIEQMLANMFIGNPPGSYDRILDFSTAVTGGLFFVPTADFLKNPTRPAPGGPAPAGSPSDGSLGIGSLNRRSAP